MSIIDLATAKRHLRLEPDYPDDQVQGKLEAAEARAAQFLNRAIFANAGALAAGRAAVPAALDAAVEAHTIAMAATQAMADADNRVLLVTQADETLAEARDHARAQLAGMVITPDVQAAVLLILGHLFENRSDVEAGVTVVEVPMASQYLLMPHRVGMGGVMRIGPLNTRVLIQRPGTPPDGWTTPPAPAWVDVAHVWCDIRHPSGAESLRADAVTSTVKASIRIRYREDLDAGMRVVHGATIYDIQAVLLDKRRRQHTDLVCEVTE